MCILNLIIARFEYSQIGGELLEVGKVDFSVGRLRVQLLHIFLIDLSELFLKFLISCISYVTLSFYEENLLLVW